MNTLDWIVNELTSTLEVYIASNKHYFIGHKIFEAIGQPAPGASGDGEATHSHLLPPAAEVVEVVGLPISASVDDLSYASCAKLKVEGLLFTKLPLKFDKYQEATQFVVRIKAIIDREMKYDRDDVKRKITDLSKILDDELAKMVEILRLHGQPSGTYDALLRIFADMLRWMKKDEILDILTVCVKYEILHERYKEFKTPIKIGTANYFIPLPLTTFLVQYLTRQALTLHLDNARNKERERIPYAVILPEVPAENVISICNFHIMAIDQHTNQNNSKESIAVRQNNNLIVLNCLRMQFSDVYSTMQGFILSVRNPFMDEMLKKLKEWSTQADDRIRERNKAIIDARLGSTISALNQ